MPFYLDTGFLKYPWGVILCLNYLYLLVYVYLKSDKWTWVRHLYGNRSMTILLSAVTAVSFIGGLVGFEKIAMSWPFALLMLAFTSVLGLRTVDDIHHWRRRRPVAVISHSAVFIVFVAIMFSSGDKEMVRITVPEGHPVHSGTDASGKPVHLPFVVTLKDFKVDEYPPKLYLLDRNDGSSSKEHLFVEKTGDSAVIGDWKLTAVRITDHAGGVPVVFVRAEHIDTDVIKEGWVSCGSPGIPSAVLPLSEHSVVAMPYPEARSYMSEISVSDEKGQHDFSVRVNHPAALGTWRIYLSGYDTKNGKWSRYVILECVNDGWAPVKKAGLWLVLISGVLMALTAGGGKKEKEDASS